MSNEDKYLSVTSPLTIHFVGCCLHRSSIVTSVFDRNIVSGELVFRPEGTLLPYLSFILFFTALLVTYTMATISKFAPKLQFLVNPKSYCRFKYIHIYIFQRLELNAISCHTCF